MGRLDGKIALISGTATGQGRAAAVIFAREGASIVGCDLKEEESRETARMVESAGGKMISTHPMDISDGDQVKAWIDSAVKTFGGIDILYNNAGALKFAPIDDMKWSEWEFTIRNELHHIYWTCHYAFPHLKARGGGVIINIASVAALRGLASVGNFAHAATKAAVIGVTKQLAAEGGPHGIRANAISPGSVITPQTARHLSMPGYKELVERAIPLRRIGIPEDIANVALFLASDEASYVNGINVVVDGGREAADMSLPASGKMYTKRLE